MSWPQKSGFWLLKMGSTVVFQFWDKDDKTKRYARILGAHHGTPFSQANDKNWIFKSFKGRNVPKPNWFKKIPKWTQFPIKRAPVGRPGTAASSMRPGSAQGMFQRSYWDVGPELFCCIKASHIIHACCICMICFRANPTEMLRCRFALCHGCIWCCMQTYPSQHFLFDYICHRLPPLTLN